MQQTLRSENISPEKVSFRLWFLTQRAVSNLFQLLYISLGNFQNAVWKMLNGPFII